MSGAGLITIPMSQMSNFSLVVHWFLMLGGGIAFLLLPPILWRIYQYRRFKPTVKKVILLREVCFSRGFSLSPGPALTRA